MLTLFAAIKPPDALLDTVQALQTGIEGVRWAPRENLHITLGYFGKVCNEYAEILDHELARSPGFGFDLKLSGVDIFTNPMPRPRPNTLWVGVEKSAALSALHNHVRSAARRAHVEMDIRNFKPHLSLAYLRRDVAKDDLARYIRQHVNYSSPEFLIDEFALFTSKRNKTGPNTYTKQANYPLIG